MFPVSCGHRTRTGRRGNEPLNVLVVLHHRHTIHVPISLSLWCLSWCALVVSSLPWGTIIRERVSDNNGCSETSSARFFFFFDPAWLAVAARLYQNRGRRLQWMNGWWDTKRNEISFIISSRPYGTAAKINNSVKFNSKQSFPSFSDRKIAFEKKQTNRNDFWWFHFISCLYDPLPVHTINLLRSAYTLLNNATRRINVAPLS